MAGDKESTLVFKVDGTQAETGVAKVKRSLNDLADTASREGQRGAAGIAGMGAGAEKSAAQIERATQRQISEIRRMTAELESGGKATRAYQEAMASIRGVDTAALRPYLDQLDQARSKMGQVGMTAGQMSNALRTVPMQFTDIVTSLASGQNAFTVFIQQGGQLKDMFGGVGVAAKAMGTYVLGLINPFTLAAGAAALLATAYYQGSKESKAYSKAIVLSGNAAGVTAGQLGDMARAMETATRTQSAASAALAEMAQNSRVGSDELQRYTAIAMDFEKVTGTAVSKTAEAFAALAKEPLQAAIKLNDGVNWLTTSTYEHIKSLEEQGRKTEAARVAQEAYANSVAQKSAQLQGNLGALEKTWNALAGAAKWAWDAMLNVGRKETLGEQLEGARKQLADAERQANIRSAGAFGTFQAGQEPSNRAAIDALKQKIALLSEQERMLKRGAEAQAAANAQVQARIALDAKYGDRLKTDAQKAKAARDEIAELGKAAGKSAEEIKRLQDASDKTFEKKGGGSSKRTSAAPGENEIARIKSMIEEEQRYISALQERGKEAEKLTAGEKLVLKLQQELQTSMSGVAKANKEKALSAAQELVSVEKLRAAEEKRIKSDEENRKRLIASIDEERAARMKLAEENAKRVDSIGKDNERMREEIETLGLSAAQIAARTIELNNATIAEKENQLARLKNDNITTREMAALEEEIRLLKERNELIGSKAAKQGAIDAAKQVEDEWKKTADSINQSLTDALMNGFDSGKSFAKNFKDTLVNMFKTLVLRPVISFIVNPIGNAISGIVSGFLGGGQGQGGAGNLLGMASNLNTAWGMLSGTGGNMGALSGAFGGSMSWANAAGSIYANTTGTGISGLLATNGAYGTAGGAGLAGSAAAGIAAIAAPLLIGALVERNSRDRYSGAAYATTGGGDPRSQVIAGSTRFNHLTGDLPDRAALLARLEELGAPMELIGDWNDRALTYLMESAAGDNSENGINWTPRIRNMRDTPDFYRGQGYAHPEELGWWNNKDNANLSTDPALIQASRDIALSIIGPLEGIGALIGDEAVYRATVGFANRGEGNGLWAGMNLQRDGQNVADWVNTDDFHSVGEAVRAMYSTALGTLDSFDLPGWADQQVTAARAALDALEGENMGQEAAALYAQATAGIEQMYRSIQMLIDVFPDFSAATQDSVHALAQLMGGMDQLQGAYSNYIQNFWTDAERADLMRAQVEAELGRVGLSLPETRDAFRDLVEAQDLSTEAGREAFAALMGVAGAFAEVTQSAAAAAEAARQLAQEAYDSARSATDAAFGALEKFIAGQRTLWQTALDAANALIGEASTIRDTAADAARDLWGQADDTRAMLAMQGNAAIDQMLGALRTTGALPDADALGKAIAGARGGLDMAGYARSADQEFAQKVLAGKLGEMGELADGQLSIAEQQADYAKQQIKQLDDTLDYWRKQLDLMRNTDLTVTSIADGIGKLVAAMEEERAAQAALDAASNTPTGNPANAGWAIGGSSGSGGGSGGAYLDYTDFTRRYADGSSALLNMNEVWMALWNSSGGDRAAAEAAYAAEEERRRREGIPSYAVGSDYVPRDMLANVHQGEIIVPAVPAAIIRTLVSNSGDSGSADLLAEVRALRDEVAGLRAEQREPAAATVRLSNQFNNVSEGGNALRTEVMA